MDDLISRQEAIDVLKRNYPSSCFEELCKAVDIAIKALSEQPEIIRCKDCKHWDIFDTHSTLMPNHKRCRGSMGKIYTAPDFYCAFGERKDG